MKENYRENPYGDLFDQIEDLKRDNKFFRKQLDSQDLFNGIQERLIDRTTTEMRNTYFKVGGVALLFYIVGVLGMFLWVGSTVNEMDHKIEAHIEECDHTRGDQ